MWSYGNVYNLCQNHKNSTKCGNPIPQKINLDFFFIALLLRNRKLSITERNQMIHKWLGCTLLRHPAVKVTPSAMEYSARCFQFEAKLKSMEKNSSKDRPQSWKNLGQKKYNLNGQTMKRKKSVANETEKNGLTS